MIWPRSGSRTQRRCDSWPRPARRALSRGGALRRESGVRRRTLSRGERRMSAVRTRVCYTAPVPAAAWRWGRTARLMVSDRLGAASPPDPGAAARLAVRSRLTRIAQQEDSSPRGRFWTAPGRSPSAWCTCRRLWPASRGRRDPASRGRWLGAAPDCGLGGRLTTPDNSGVWGEGRSAWALGEWLERCSVI